MMNLSYRLSVCLVALMALVAGCGRAGSEESARDENAVIPIDVPDDGKPVLVVTNSYLGAAARDLLGEGWHVVSLQPPGRCPGHFDTTVEMVKVIHRSPMLVRFDFQSGLDAQMQDFDNLAIAEVVAPEGLSTPVAYQQVVQGLYPQVMNVVDQTSHGALNKRLTDAVQRMEDLDEELKKSAADGGLVDLPVVASGHMAVFCERLGMNVLGRYGSPGAASPRDLASLVEAGRGARLVVATEQEGVQQARFLAERLGGAPVVSLSNFPASCEAQSFDAMARGNVKALVNGLAR